jgi:hypothetical protein
MNFDTRSLGNQYLNESKNHLKRPTDQVDLNSEKISNEHKDKGSSNR